MKRTGTFTAILAAAALAVACNGDPRDREDIGEESAVGTSGAASESDQRDAAQFAQDVARVGIAEVKLGELASTKGQHADVKRFGQMMATDHTKGLQNLKAAVQPYGIELPTDTDGDHKDLYDSLSAKRGAEFDREYMAAMVEGHEKMQAKLEARIAKSSAPATAEMAVADYARQALPTVEKHFGQAKQIQASLR